MAGGAGKDGGLPSRQRGEHVRAVEGRSVATTMGFTALEGLPMGTRCGAVDPGVLLYLFTQEGMSPAAITDILYHRSGLLGLSGHSGDMRDLLPNPSLASVEAGYSATGSGASWGRWPPRWGVSTPWCLPGGSASTRPRCGPGSRNVRHGWGSVSIRRRTRRAGLPCTRPRAPSPFTSFPPMKS